MKEWLGQGSESMWTALKMQPDLHTNKYKSTDTNMAGNGPKVLFEKTSHSFLLANAGGLATSSPSCNAASHLLYRPTWKSEMLQDKYYCSDWDGDAISSSSSSSSYSVSIHPHKLNSLSSHIDDMQIIPRLTGAVGLSSLVWIDNELDSPFFST